MGHGDPREAGVEFLGFVYITYIYIYIYIIYIWWYNLQIWYKAVLTYIQEDR